MQRTSLRSPLTLRLGRFAVITDMGQDLSVVLTNRPISQADLFGVVQASLPTSDHMVAVLVFGATPVAFPALAASLPAFTTFSVWADGETSGCLQRVAEGLSALLRSPCLVLTAADHSCVGGWELFRDGSLVQDQWCSGSGYLDVSLEGVSVFASTSHPLPLPPSDRGLGLVSLLAEPTSAVCLRSSSSVLPAGQFLSCHLITALFEDDLPGLTLECLLGGAP